MHFVNIGGDFRRKSKVIGQKNRGAFWFPDRGSRYAAAARSLRSWRLQWRGRKWRWFCGSRASVQSLLNGFLLEFDHEEKGLFSKGSNPRITDDPLVKGDDAVLWQFQGLCDGLSWVLASVMAANAGYNRCDPPTSAFSYRLWPCGTKPGERAKSKV